MKLKDGGLDLWNIEVLYNLWKPGLRSIQVHTMGLGVLRYTPETTQICR